MTPEDRAEIAFAAEVARSLAQTVRKPRNMFDEGDRLREDMNAMSHGMEKIAEALLRIAGRTP